MKAVVVGAGIGGLTAAIALRRAGLEVEIVEGATRLAEIGAGLSLWPNAIEALAALGLADEVTARGVELDLGAVRSRDGRPAFLWDRDACLEFLDGIPVMIHRSELQSCLLAACGDVPLRLGARATTVERLIHGYQVVLRNGDSVRADLVIGADGIRSAVRRSVEPSLPRYAGLTSWRAVIDRPYPEGSSMWVADGKQFLTTALAQDKTYISGLLHLPEGHNRAQPAWGPVLREAFDGWDHVVTAAIDAIPEDGYYRDDIYYRPPAKQLVWEQVVLIGDAAHPITPDLGQGGCQAIEDAVTLGLCLNDQMSIEDALCLYQASRLPRVRRVARDSKVVGLAMASRHRVAPSTAIPSTLLALQRITRQAGRIQLKQLARHASRKAFHASLPRSVEGYRKNPADQSPAV